MQAEANAAEAAERQRLQALAEEVKQFNELKLLQLTEQERQERCTPEEAACLACCRVHAEPAAKLSDLVGLQTATRIMHQPCHTLLW